MMLSWTNNAALPPADAVRRPTKNAGCWMRLANICKPRDIAHIKRAIACLDDLGAAS